ncbi:hypothetical protein F5I97DRAFT_1956996 [Phlebopus sp. FC_14]|nr:hypothetical protein F5I97DRAFT_1956996 [Phlebopus sp. FC_14]
MLRAPAHSKPLALTKNPVRFQPFSLSYSSGTSSRFVGQFLKQLSHLLGSQMSSRNYGGTGQPPPPYSLESTHITSAAQSSRWHPAQNSERQALLETARPPLNTYQEGSIPTSCTPSDKKSKLRGCMNSKLFIIVITSLLTLVLFSAILPVTYCDDPADPKVRERERKKFYEEQRAWDEERKEHEMRQVRWELEEERREAQLREWEQENKDHERKLQERAQREEDERKRLNMYWARVETHQCTTYATREYTAVLTNVPMDYDRSLEACRLTPLTINGVSYLPSRCEDNGPHAIIGYWTVNQHEPECTTYWREYRDKGCTSQGSGKRLIEHYLEMLPKGGDWSKFCATTPIRFHDMEFQGAQHCNQQVSSPSMIPTIDWTSFAQHQGTYGYWEIDDATC